MKRLLLTAACCAFLSACDESITLANDSDPSLLVLPVNARVTKISFDARTVQPSLSVRNLADPRPAADFSCKVTRAGRPASYFFIQEQ